MHEAHQSEGPGVEETDISLPVVIGMLAIVAATVVFTFIFVLVGSKALMKNRPPVAESIHPLADMAAEVEPTGPLLQFNPPIELEDFLAAEEEWLTSYGFIARDEEKVEDSVVRVPIERAIEMAVEHGVPKFEPSAR